MATYKCKIEKQMFEKDAVIELKLDINDTVITGEVKYGINEQGWTISMPLLKSPLSGTNVNNQITFETEHFSGKYAGIDYIIWIKGTGNLFQGKLQADLDFHMESVHTKKVDFIEK